MNFIFDIGNVLLDFKPEVFLHGLLANPFDEEKLNELIFKSREWVKLDEGTITSKDACDNFCLREPQYRELIIKVMEKLPEMLTPISETIELLPKIKASGHKLYYLSNYHAELARYVQNKYSFFGLFDGGVFSYDVHLLKPSFEIYQYLLDKYRLDPNESLFFDDMKENVKSAEHLGIKCILFTDVQQIKDFL